MGVSKVLAAITNFIVLLMSIMIVGAGIWLKTRGGGGQCVQFLQTPVLVIGIVILLVALVGFLGVLCDVTWLQWIYLFVIFCFMILLFVFTVFAFVVTNAKAGEVVSGQGFKNYRVGDYSNWLQQQVNSTSNWAAISSCIAASNVCPTLATKYTTQTALLSSNLTPAEAGCCIPPPDCSYSFVNATYWTPPVAPLLTNDTDCPLWSNNQTQLCYGCDTCKAGVLQNVKQDWKVVAIINIIAFVVIFIVYSIGCCAYRQSRRDQQGYTKSGF